jgi:hypothetical protein
MSKEVKTSSIKNLKLPRAYLPIIDGKKPMELRVKT